MSMKPWREIAEPHRDVREGKFQQAEFAADISRVHAGSAGPEYQDPVLFFERTFITEGMRLLLDSVVRRLAGKGGDPVIQLQTAFGGGKTHTMLAVYHLAKGEVPASQMQGIPAILDVAGVAELPQARIVVLDGIKASPNQPINRDGLTIKTLWGDLAWQLGGRDGYELVADADASGTSPGKAALEALLAHYAPCVILVDELVAYVRQFEEGKALTGGTFDSNLTFIQALTEALKAVPTAVLLASLPESEREAGSQRGEKALASLSHYFGRVQALWKPVATEEAFEIVRRRLFSNIADRAAAEAVCRAYAQFYAQHREDFPQETQESVYLDRLLHAYPIHPEVFDRLYEDWSTLPNFQRTRGVLRLMAKVIHRLWKDGNNDALVMPGSLPLYDAETRNDLVTYLAQGWDPVIERDVDGERAETTEVESRDTRLGAVQGCRRVARAIFLGSAPGSVAVNNMTLARGVESKRILLGTVQAGQQVGVYKDALKRLGDKLHYLNQANDRYWLDTRPNLRREMEERSRRFQDREDVFPVIGDALRKMLGNGPFGAVHVFTQSADIPDDPTLRLVVLPPDAPFTKSGRSLANEKAVDILKKRGEQPRFRQNRLLFLAADYDGLSRLKEQVCSRLAWQSIIADNKDLKLNLDQFQARQASKSFEDATETMNRMVRETFKWLLSPHQEAKTGKVGDLVWEHFPLNPSAQNAAGEIERVLKENELLITEWAPIHLSRLLKDWFWKGTEAEVGAEHVWQQCCQQLFLPRLKDQSVFVRTVAAGVESRDFFGIAQGRDEGRYLGFTFGQRTTPFMDSSLLLIEPASAVAFEASEKARAAAEAAAQGGGAAPAPYPGGEFSPGGVKNDPRVQPGGGQPVVPPPAVPKAPKKRFYGAIDLDAFQAKKQFVDLMDEVVLQFTSKPGVKVRISIEIEAESATGFDDGVQRAVKENCSVLKFKNSEFEDGD